MIFPWTVRVARRAALGLAVGLVAGMPGSRADEAAGSELPTPRWPDESTISTGRPGATASSSSIVGGRPSFSCRA